MSGASRPMSGAMPAAAQLAACAELGWRDAAGALHAIAFTPLVIDGAVVAALPFDRTSVAERLDAAGAAVLTVSDSRLALKGWVPLAQPVRVTVTADRDGDWTWTGALDQEVRKHPPSRLLIDTSIQRREHWWYVPRWVVRLDPAGPAEPCPRRGPDDGVLFGECDGAFVARCVAVDDWEADRIRLTPLDHTQPLDAAVVPAALLAHTFSIPDMERWDRLVLVGRRDGAHLQVERRHGRATLAPPTGLLRRLTDHWGRERACRRALAAYDASRSAT